MSSRGVRRHPGQAAEHSPVSSPTTIRLTQEQVYFLDCFRARVSRDTGCRIPRGTLLQMLVEAAAAAPVDIRSVTSEFELTRLLCEASVENRERERQ